jgi:PAS domain-containing protein
MQHAILLVAWVGRTMSPPVDADRVLGPLARARRDEIAHYLASIVESCNDAIFTIDLDGIITSWNVSAERLYGYTPEEALGKPTTMLIPLERHDEETAILERIKRGERVEHYETVRQHNMDVLLTFRLPSLPSKMPKVRLSARQKFPATFLSASARKIVKNS